MRGVLAVVLLAKCADVQPYVRHPPADNYEPYVVRSVYVPFEAVEPPTPQDDRVMVYPVPGCMEDDCTVAETPPTTDPSP